MRIPEATQPFEKETRSLLHTLKKHGVTVTAVNDGCELVKVTDCHPLETILSVWDSSVKVTLPDGETRGIYIVLGNSPGELVCDYGCHPLLDTIVNEHTNRWEA